MKIRKILRNEVYLGKVVGRKFQKISNKITKVKATYFICSKRNNYSSCKQISANIIDSKINNIIKKKIKKVSLLDRKYMKMQKSANSKYSLMQTNRSKA